MDNFSESQIIRKPAVQSNKGMVTAQHKKAAAIGADILSQGGDAIDAAIATSFAIGVLEPWMSGPAGGGSMLIWREKEQRAEVIHFGMQSPKQLNPKDFPLSNDGQSSDLFPWKNVVDDLNVSGPTSVAVPGTVAGMGLAFTKYSKLNWADLLAPAITQAKIGINIDWYSALIIASSTQVLAKYPSSSKIWLEDNQWPTIAAWTALSDKRVIMENVANTLEQLAIAGWQDFYIGDIANTLVNDVRSDGGSLSIEDMNTYMAQSLQPLVIPYRGGRLFTPPGLTAGPTLAHCLSSLSHQLKNNKQVNANTYCAYIDALKASYADRLSTMGDVDDQKAPGCTTHFNVVDKEGNMVCVTQTLLSIFGSKYTSANTGLLLNNGNMWFDPEQGKPNSLAGGKRCLMNICPTIGEIDNRRFAIGASGGRKILPAVLQLSSFLMDYDLSLEAAFHQARIDSSGSKIAILDQSLPESILTEIESKHAAVRTRRTVFPYAFACPSAIIRENGINQGCTEIMSAWGDTVIEQPMQ